MKSLIVLFVCGLIEVSKSESCNVPPGAINLARYGKVCQSSTLVSDPMPGPERAVDGISETDFYKHPCSHTNLEQEPWWRLDMGESFLIGFVVIVNRVDCCPERLKGAEIRIGDSSDNNNTLCATVTDVSKPALTFFCRAMQGQYLTVIKPNGGVLTLCEIKVYQHVPEEGELAHS